MSDELCKHLLPPSQCTHCIPSKPAYFSDGGSKFHKSPTCATFVRWRKEVVDNGGVNSPIRTTTEHQARFHRLPCWECYPN